MECSGFNQVLVKVSLNDSVDVVTREEWERSIQNKSKLVVKRQQVISIASLCFPSQPVILSSFETRPLENAGAYWPGYSIDKHEKNLKLGLETILVEKRGDQFTISFPKGDAV